MAKVYGRNITQDEYDYIVDTVAIHSWPDFEVIGYHLDPDLFHTWEEAAAAMSELQHCFDREMTKTEEHGHKYKEANTYGRDMKALQDNLKKARDQYIKLGGDPNYYDAAMELIPKPKIRTLKQEISTYREEIKNDFITMGISKTRADKIAKVITQQAYQSLK